VNQPPRSSLMYLGAGQTASLNELFLGLAIPSGNDAAVAVALTFYPTVAEFADRMNETMRNLGLENSYFVEPSGISEDNYTTARDFARFCMAYIYRFPDNLRKFHSVSSFQWPKPENVAPAERQNLKFYNHHNHIGIINAFSGADGLKTGYIDESGYNLAATAIRDDTRFIAVVLGVPAALGGYWGPVTRDQDAASLLAWAYDNYYTARLELPTEIPPLKIWKGAANTVALVPAVTETPAVAVTLPVGRGTEYAWDPALPADPVIAPVDEGMALGTLTAIDLEGPLYSTPLLAAESVAPGNIFKRLWDSVVLFFVGLGK
jgi:D-alanyl-D-alanine carboxypeptidase (penicillin-binding protein 5/6)